MDLGGAFKDVQTTPLKIQLQHGLATIVLNHVCKPARPEMPKMTQLSALRDASYTTTVISTQQRIFTDA